MELLPPVTSPPIPPPPSARNLQDETRTGKPPNLAKVQAPLKMDQLGGSRFGPGRAEYRLWTVLAIGAGAVGSFMAVVVFAVGQYRKVGGGGSTCECAFLVEVRNEVSYHTQKRNNVTLCVHSRVCFCFYFLFHHWCRTFLFLSLIFAPVKAAPSRRHHGPDLHHPLRRGRGRWRTCLTAFSHPLPLFPCWRFVYPCALPAGAAPFEGHHGP